MFILGMVIIYSIVCFKTVKGYFQIESCLKCEEPPYIETEYAKPNSIYEGSIKGIINLQDYQRS